jgi:Outer membrane protein beta-barrel domain
MKKLTLTFCALFALVVVAPALYADGPEQYSGKEKEVMQPAPPVCDFYRAHEWDLSIWGAYAFAADTGQFNVPNDDPFFPDTDVTNSTVLSFLGIPLTTLSSSEPANFNPRERVNIGRVSNNQLFARDDVWGGGADVKYFFSRYVGVGLEGVGLAAKTNFAGGGLVTLTGRYPFGRFAPYVTGGIGFIDGGATLYKFFNEKPVIANGVVTNEHEFWTTDPVANNHLRALGQIGAGLEFRVTCHIGLMADFTWNFVFGQDDNHVDKIHLITEQGTSTTTFIDILGAPTTTTSTVVINQALELRPGHGSDNQDFGMARFGVTFSY